MILVNISKDCKMKLAYSLHCIYCITRMFIVGYCIHCLMLMWTPPILALQFLDCSDLKELYDENELNLF